LKAACNIYKELIPLSSILQIEPQLLSGKNVMISAHGNSLRSIIMYLDKLTSQEVAGVFKIIVALKFAYYSTYSFFFFTRSLVWNCQLEFPCFTFSKREDSLGGEVP